MKKLFSTLIVALFAFAAADAQVTKWGYCDDEVTDCASLYVEAAIEIPEDVAKAFEGKQVTGVEVKVFGSAKNFQTHIWEDLSVPSVPVLSGEKLATFSASEWTTFNFDTPYTIGEKKFYVGYSTDSKYAIGKAPNNAPFFARKSSKDWEELKTGSLAVRMIVDGVELPIDASLLAINDVVCGAKKNYTIEGKVKNTGTTAIQNFEIVYGVDDAPLRRHSFEIEVAPGATESFSFDVNGQTLDKGNHNLHAILDKVNGSDLPYLTGKEKFVPMEVLTYFYPKYMVVEKKTGDWCGYCPSGIVAFEHMEKYPRFIGIAVHGQDQLTISEYLSHIEKWIKGGYPNAVEMRKGNYFKPAGSVLEDHYKAQYETGSAEAGVRLQAQWTNASENKIKLVATTAFSKNNTAANYGLTFVTLENNISWRQNNYPDSGAWEEKGTGYVPCIYNHIPRATTAVNGVPNSVPTSLRAGQEYVFEYELPLASTVSKKQNIDIVVMLIDRNTEAIVNAYKLPYDQIYKYDEKMPEATDIVIPLDPLADGSPEPDPDAIRSTVMGAAAKGVYDLSGRQISNDRTQVPAGLYIVNGRKVVVK